jgi:hypothetical protein
VPVRASVTLSGAVPFLGVAVTFAVGAWLAGAPELELDEEWLPELDAEPECDPLPDEDADALPEWDDELDELPPAFGLVVHPATAMEAIRTQAKMAIRRMISTWTWLLIAVLGLSLVPIVQANAVKATRGSPGAR